MEKETIRERLISELNDSTLLYKDRQKFKKEELPKDFLEKLILKYSKERKLTAIAFSILGMIIIFSLFTSHLFAKSSFSLQLLGIQLTPLLGVLFFGSQNKNLAKRIFILKLLLDWDD